MRFTQEPGNEGSMTIRHHCLGVPVMREDRRTNRDVPLDCLAYINHGIIITWHHNWATSLAYFPNRLGHTCSLHISAASSCFPPSITLSNDPWNQAQRWCGYVRASRASTNSPTSVSPDVRSMISRNLQRVIKNSNKGMEIHEWFHHYQGS